MPTKSARSFARGHAVSQPADILETAVTTRNRPRIYETLLPNRMYNLFGAAWAGETDATEIAISTMMAGPGPKRIFSILCDGLRGDVGNLIG
jgi:hypothetical protein